MRTMLTTCAASARRFAPATLHSACAGTAMRVRLPRGLHTASVRSAGSDREAVNATPDEWLDDANAELAEWFGEVNPNQGKAKRASASAQAHDADVTSSPRMNLTQLMMRGKRDSTSAPRPPQINHQQHDMRAPTQPTIQEYDNDGAYGMGEGITAAASTPAATAASSRSSGTTIIQHHHHTHHHYYAGVTPPVAAPATPAAPFTSSSSSSAEFPFPSSFASPPAAAAAPLSDRLVSESLVRRWCALANARDFHGLLDLFSEECVFSSPLGELVGRSNFLPLLEQLLSGGVHLDRVLVDTHQSAVQLIYRTSLDVSSASVSEVWQLDRDGRIASVEQFNGRSTTRT